MVNKDSPLLEIVYRYRYSQRKKDELPPWWP